LLVGFWLVVAGVVLLSGERWGIWDWDHHLAFYELERQSLLAGAAPFWNPHTAGGTVLLQHPLASFLSPDFGFVLALGVPLGVKVLLTFRLAVGLAGGFALARELGSSRVAACLASAIMCGGGAYAAHVAYGHFEWTTLGYLPWLLFFLLRAAERHSGRAVAAAGVLGAIVYLSGGGYLLVGAALAWGGWFSLQAVLERNPAWLIAPLCGALLALAMSGAKLWPSAVHVADHSRKTVQHFQLFDPEPSQGVLEIPRALSFSLLERSFVEPEFARNPSHNLPHPRPSAAERYVLFQAINYRSYVGFVPLILIAFCVVAGGRHAWPLVAGAGLLLTVGFSDSIDRSIGVHPWHALQALPGLSNLGVGGRLLAPVTIPLGLLAAHGLDVAVSRLPEVHRTLGARLAFALTLFVTVDLSIYTGTLLGRSFPHEPLAPMPRPFATSVRPVLGFDLATVRSGVGALGGHSNLRPARRAVSLGTPGYRGEAHLVLPGRAALTEIQSDGLEVEVESPGTNVLVINQNHHPGWRRIDREASVHERDGLLATEIEPRDRRVQLGYRPPGLTTGISLSAAGLAAAIALFVWNPSRQSS
jgi:hypothetical protein